MIQAFLKKYHQELIIFSVVFLLRMIFFGLMMFGLSAVFHEYPGIGGDSRNFISLADGIRETGRFAYIEDSRPNSYEMPGYPVFLIMVETFAGGLAAVPVLQNILAGLSAVLLFRIGLLISGKVGWSAAALFAVDPAGIFYSNFIVTEPLFIFLTLLAAYYLFAPLESPVIDNKDDTNKVLMPFRKGRITVPPFLTEFIHKDNMIFHAVLPALLLGIATYVRPVSIVFVPAFALFFLLVNIRSLKRSAIAVLVFAVSFFIVVAPWMARNKMLFGRFELTSVASFQFYHAHAPHFYAYKNQISKREAERVFQERLIAIDPHTEEALQGYVGSLRHTPYMWKVALDYIKEDPLGYAWFHVVKTGPFFLSDGLREISSRMKLIQGSVPGVGDLILNKDFKTMKQVFAGNQKALILFALGFTIWFFINTFMFLGFILCFKQEKRIRALIIVSFLVVCMTALIAGGSVSHPRYRFSVSPFMFFVASYGFWILKDALMTKRQAIDV